MDAPSLEAFEARLDVALGSLVWWLAALHIAGGLKLDDHCGPFQPRPFYDSMNSQPSQMFFLVKITVQKYSLHATLLKVLVLLLLKTAISFPLFLLFYFKIKKKKGYSLAVIPGLNMQTFLLTLNFPPSQSELQHVVI